MTHSSWGPGWPSCQYDKIDRNFSVITKWGVVSFPGGVRREITELVRRLVIETSNRGYRFGQPGNPSYGCWGFSCRAIRGSTAPSNHSWGLAVDINAPSNPMGDRLITNMPSWMPDLWNAYGFRWGGDYRTRPDAMHYEFMGSVADAARYTQIARNNRLGENRALPPSFPPPEATVSLEDKVYFLYKGDAKPEWWLTDGLTKRHMRTQDEANHWIFVISAMGGKVDRAANNQPKTVKQAYIDNIERSDADQELHSILSWYAAAKQGPLHEIVKQVLASQ